MDELPLRTCTGCLIAKPATREFFSKKYDGLDTRCKECKSAYKRQWDDVNREYINNKQRDYYADNVDYGREYARNRRAEHPDIMKQVNERNYINHREQRIEDARNYRQQNPHKERERYAVNPSKKRAQSAYRRAIKRGILGTVTVSDIQSQYQQQSGCCMWCSKFVGRRYDLDHVIPLAKNGTHTPDNIVISCPTCNRKKGKKLVFIEWTPPNQLDC